MDFFCIVWDGMGKGVVLTVVVVRIVVAVFGHILLIANQSIYR